MSKVDTTFDFGGPLIREWGLDATVYKRMGDVYNPSTGTVAVNETPMAVKVVIGAVTPKEYEGVYQENDIVIYTDVSAMAPYAPETDDRILYPAYDGSGSRSGKVIMSKIYRGDNAVYCKSLVRPQ